MANNLEHILFLYTPCKDVYGSLQAPAYSSSNFLDCTQTRKSRNHCTEGQQFCNWSRHFTRLCKQAGVHGILLYWLYRSVRFPEFGCRTAVVNCAATHTLNKLGGTVGHCTLDVPLPKHSRYFLMSWQTIWSTYYFCAYAVRSLKSDAIQLQ